VSKHDDNRVSRTLGRHARLSSDTTQVIQERNVMDVTESPAFYELEPGNGVIIGEEKSYGS